MEESGTPKATTATAMFKSVSFAGLPTTSKKTDDVDVDIWRSKIDMPVFSHGRKGVFTFKKGPIIVAFFIVCLIIILYGLTHSNSWGYQSQFPGSNIHSVTKYNATYPLSSSWRSSSGGMCYKIGFITDMDTDSKFSKNGKESWRSYLRTATLDFGASNNQVTVDLIETDMNAIELKSTLSQGGRGMELSELVVFNGRIYTVDDRTGIVYEIHNNKAITWVILPDGDGYQGKGFKGEWMAVKNNLLYVGGLGKEWTDDNGVVLHNHPQWVKIIDPQGSIIHEDWGYAYTAMRKKAGYTHPGYIIHESAAWSNAHKAWFFLPRRASTDPYDDVTDEERGTNILFKCTNNFKDIEIITIGKLDHRTRGFSSFKFVPGTQDSIIIALKSEEYKGTTRSYITAFTVDGQILMPDMIMSEKYKYEGVEFL